MSLMLWNDDLKVGHARIDTEHKKLVDLINQLSDAMAAGNGKDVCGRVLAELISYTQTHFAMEEHLMATIRYPQAIAHKAEHDKLVGEVLAFRKKFDAGALMLSVSLLNFLKDWLTTHILNTDKALAAALAAK